MFNQKYNLISHLNSERRKYASYRNDYETNLPWKIKLSKCPGSEQYTHEQINRHRTRHKAHIQIPRQQFLTFYRNAIHSRLLPAFLTSTSSRDITFSQNRHHSFTTHKNNVSLFKFLNIQQLFTLLSPPLLPVPSSNSN